MLYARALFGSRAVIAGVAFVALGLVLAEVAHRHEHLVPLYFDGRPRGHATGWPDALHDAAVVVAWLSILVGLIWVIVGLIRYWSLERAASR